MREMRFSASKLEAFCSDVLQSLGFSLQDANTAAQSLVRAELEGAGSHGVSRLAIYSRRIKEGRIAASPKIQMRQTGSILQVDGGNGLGQVVASRTLEALIPLARDYGMSGAFIRNSNHFGTAAYYCQEACREGMVLIGFTNSPPGVAPWGGKTAYLGTNPIAFGFPVKDGPPVIVDMSSSVVARGKIILADKERRSIPLGWAIDENGEETTDPAKALNGAVLPLGGAKGYALAMAVEIFAGVLSGSAFGPHVNNLYKEGEPPADVGHCFLMLDISKWMDPEQYFNRLDLFLTEVKSVPLAKQAKEILYPGERRDRTYTVNHEKGVPLSDHVLQELRQLGAECSVPFPEPQIT